MARRHTNRSQASRRGATTVEFALTVPLLFLMLFGALEFGRANMLYHTVVVAATEGARRSIVPGATAADCKDTAVKELEIVGFPTADVVISPTVITEDTQEVTVSINVPLNGENGFSLPRFFEGAVIAKEVTLQRESAVVDVNSEKVNAGKKLKPGKGKKGAADENVS